jgi:hypothetical protein
MTDPIEHNRAAWNRQSTSGTSPWCEPVDATVIAAARRGDWQVILTPYEDRWNERATPLERFMPTSMATLALLPEQ